MPFDNRCGRPGSEFMGCDRFTFEGAISRSWGLRTSLWAGPGHHLAGGMVPGGLSGSSRPGQWQGDGLTHILVHAREILCLELTPEV